MSPCIKTSGFCLIALLAGVIGAILSMTPAGNSLEEELGLAWLFKLRGPIASPEEVVIVSIDKTSAEVLQLPDKPEKWQRSYYAGLIDRLNQQKPALIALNIYFGESRDYENDAMLAKSISNSGNIILINSLKRSVSAGLTSGNEIRYEQIIDPAPLLQSAALDTAPFPLRQIALTVKQFWTYKNSAGDVATLPVTIFQCYIFKNTYPEILQLLKKIDPEFSAGLPKTFEQLKGETKLSETLKKIQAVFINRVNSTEAFAQLLKTGNYPPEKNRLLQSWWSFLVNTDSLLYLNHYGKAGAFATIPFYQALSGEGLKADVFRNKIIMIGHSENIATENDNRDYYTDFSTYGEETTSAIEIAATATANLLGNAWLKPLPLGYQFFLVLLWGYLLAALGRIFDYKFATFLVVLLSAGYMAITYYLFSVHTVWIPFFIPVLLQTPLILIALSTCRFIKSRRDHQNIYKAFSYYVPDNVVDTVADKPDVNQMNQYGELTQGVCMATDAGQYTRLSETMTPHDLHILMNSYYAAIFPQVKNRYGIISDVIGDAMLALWTGNGDQMTTQARVNACHAALRIQSAVDRFNESQPHPIETRMGLHFGEMRLGNVGAADHYEYRAIGDTVNTATRIEGLNKKLGTHILVSGNVIDALPDFFTREMGVFILPGKTLPITIFELTDLLGRAETRQAQLAQLFAAALRLFQDYQWPEALQAFNDITRHYTNDGPTRFYINYLQNRIALSPEQNSRTYPATIEITK
ncbi:MAG: CHASE2 domain-containing protein [Methylococcaceae bacterium]